jgi:hypothetical protein
MIYEADSPVTFKIDYDTLEAFAAATAAAEDGAG